MLLFLRLQQLIRALFRTFGEANLPSTIYMHRKEFQMDRSLIDLTVQSFKMDFNSITWQRRNGCCASPTWDDGLTNFLRKNNAFSGIFIWFLGRKRQVNIESTTSRVITLVEKDCLQNWVFDSSRFLIGFLFMSRFVYSFQLLGELNTCRIGKGKKGTRENI